MSASKSGELFSNIAPWLAALVLLVIAGGIALVWIRRSVRNSGPPIAHGFTLQDLRDMRAAGELSDEEFERARSKMISQLRGKPSDDVADEASGSLGRDEPAGASGNDPFPGRHDPDNPDN